ncbi:MAG: ROK family protein [Chloroflexi bacterium]|nr:ROK family protein [Chloroflexota bacterium]
MVNKSYILTIDLGGTRFRVAVVDADGKILHRASELTRTKEGQENTLKRINDKIRQVAAKVGLNAIAGLGAAVAGPVDPEAGVLFKPPNLQGWDNTPLREIWEAEFSLPVLVGNDANMAALAEHRFGAGRGYQHMIYLGVGTGIGGGVIIEGRLLLGAQGLATEPGHMTIDLAGPRCKCGNVGCLEMLASGLAIARWANERLARGAKSALQGKRVVGETVIAAARSGDGLARGILEIVGSYLGVGVVNLVHIFNPQAVVIGGGVAIQAGDLLLDPVRRVVAERAMPSFRQVAILPSALGDDAGLRGAACLILDSLSGEGLSFAGHHEGAQA